MTQHSRAEYYRRLGVEAQQRAGQTTNLSLKEAFKDVARGWFTLADQMEWMDSRHNRVQGDDKNE
jgi:hypothetical protein